MEVPVLADVRLASDPTRSVDLHLADGRIDRITPAGSGSLPTGAIDGEGALLLPGFVDAHCHVDKTLWGLPWVPNSSGPALADRIANEQRRRSEFDIPDPERATALLRQMAAHGTTLVRTHVDVDPVLGTSGIESVLAAADLMSVQLVAFPQGGMLSNPGTVAVLDEALRMGAHVVGGLDPAGIDNDPIAALDELFALSERHDGRPIDIHLHDGGSLGLWETHRVIERTRAHGMAGRVNLSHAFGVAETTGEDSRAVLAALAEAGVSLTTAAVYSSPVPPVLAALDAGVEVALGNDGIRDLWGPWGDGDMLARTMHLAYRSGMRTDSDIERALDVMLTGGRRVLGADPVTLSPGAPADLVTVLAGTPAEAVAARPERRLVIRAGRVVARQGRLTTGALS